MPTTLPEYTRLIDNTFTDTFQEIQSEFQDQVLLSTVVWALLKMKGCFKSQPGGDLITRTVRYDFQTPTAVEKGDLLPAGTQEEYTEARWTFRNLAGHVQRNIYKDVENVGRWKIADYVERQLRSAKDGIGQKYETDLFRAHVTAETGKEIQGLRDLLPPTATRTTGTYGLIARPAAYTQDATTLVDTPTVGTTNEWYSPRYKQFHAPLDVMLATDFRNFYNVVTNQQEAPDIILTTQTLYETYEEFGLDAIQVMHNEKILNLGFDGLKYKAADLTYTPNMATGQAMFLNSNYIECIYNPLMWFSMSEWKQAPREDVRIAHILCRMNIISDNLRRHGLLYV